MSRTNIKLITDSYILAYILWGIARHFNCTVCMYIAIAFIVWTIIKMLLSVIAETKIYKDERTAENLIILRKAYIFLIIDILFFALIIISMYM